MAQIPFIDDSYIDEIIKSAEAYNPALNKTQGVKLRELIKRLRDRVEQNNEGVVHSTGDQNITGSKTFSQLGAAEFSLVKDGFASILKNPLNQTQNYVYTLPKGGGELAVKGGLTKADFGLGNVDNTSDAGKPLSLAAQIALGSYQLKSEKATANGYASLGADGKVPSSQIPALAISLQNVMTNGSETSIPMVFKDGSSALRIAQGGGINYIQSGIDLTTGSTAPLVFGGISGVGETMRLSGGNTFLSGLLRLPNGYNLEWGGDYSGGWPTIASSSTSGINLYGGGNTAAPVQITTLSNVIVPGYIASTANVVTNGPGTFRENQIKTNGVLRWSMFGSSGAETGSNSGTDYGIARYDDAGNYLGQPLVINRATSKWDIQGNVSTNGVLSPVSLELARDLMTSDPYAPISVTRGISEDFAYYGMTRAGQTALQIGISQDNAMIFGTGTPADGGTMTSKRLQLYSGNSIFTGNVSTTTVPTSGEHLTNKTYVDGLVTGFEFLSNKSGNVSLGTSNTLYPTQNAVKSYADTKAPKDGVGTSGSWPINSSTATALQTHRTLWGVPFNGTQSVNGPLTGVTSITASSNILGGVIQSQLSGTGPDVNLPGLYMYNFGGDIKLGCITSPGVVGGSLTFKAQTQSVSGITSTVRISVPTPVTASEVTTKAYVDGIVRPNETTDFTCNPAGSKGFYRYKGTTTSATVYLGVLAGNVGSSAIIVNRGTTGLSLVTTTLGGSFLDVDGVISNHYTVPPNSQTIVFCDGIYWYVIKK